MTDAQENARRQPLKTTFFALIIVLLFAGAIVSSWTIGYSAGERDAMEQQCASQLMQLHVFRKQLEREEPDEAVNFIHRNMWSQLKCLELYADEQRSDESILQAYRTTQDYLTDLYGDQPPP